MLTINVNNCIKYPKACLILCCCCKFFKMSPKTVETIFNVRLKQTDNIFKNLPMLKKSFHYCCHDSIDKSRPPLASYENLV